MNQPTRDPGICPPVPSTPAARTYLVQKNDTFWEIAKRLYPDHPQDRQAVSDRTEKIRAANPTRFIGGAEVPVDPQNLPVGLEITLPDVPNTNPDSDSFSVSIEQGLA
jgi:phage tail protein X